MAGIPKAAPPPSPPLYRHRQLAPTASIRVSPICLGSMNFGEANKQRLGECSKETTFEILDTFKNLGGTFIDTSIGYQLGESERWIGEWMSSRNIRDEMVITVKYTTPFALQHPEKIQSNFGGNGSKSLKLSVEKSLERLQTSYADLLFVNWWDFTTTIPELMHSLNDLVTSGKALYLGIADSPAWVVAKANQYARDHGLRQFVVYQGQWNAAARDVESDIIPMCKDEGMGFMAWGTLGEGKFKTEKGYKDLEKNTEGRKMGPASELDKKVSKVLEEMAEEKGTLLTSVALAYVIQKAPYVFPIVGGRKVEHLKANVEALKISLTEEEIAKIDAASKFNPGFPHNFLTGGHGVVNYKLAEGPKDVWLTFIQGAFDFVEGQKAIKPVKL